MEKMPTFEEFKKEVLKDPKVKAAYEALRPEFERLIQRLKARKKRVSRKKK